MNRKILALDIGDQWTGTALSDLLGFTAKPYGTVPTSQLEDFISKTIEREPIKEIVIGYPITLRGTESMQTKKITEKKKQLEHDFPTITWQLWDERLTSKQAAGIKKAKTKEEKIQSHSIAAALILQSYLEYLYQQSLSTS
jgi:putative pre-16S rRNA nuclease